jgi:hypothetical protein
MCHGFGLDRSSDTEPWERPSTASPNSCTRGGHDVSTVRPVNEWSPPPYSIDSRLKVQ